MLGRKKYTEPKEPEFMGYLSDEGLSDDDGTIGKKIILKNNLMIARGLMIRDYGSIEDAKEAMNSYYQKINSNLHRKRDKASLEKNKQKLKEEIFDNSRRHAKYLRRIREIERTSIGSIDELV